MDSMTHFHSINKYFYINYSNSLKVTALDMFQTQQKQSKRKQIRNKQQNGLTPVLI